MIFGGCCCYHPESVPPKWSSSWCDQIWVVVRKVVDVQQLYLSRMYPSLDHGPVLPKRRTSRHVCYFLCASCDYSNRRVWLMNSSSLEVVFWKKKKKRSIQSFHFCPLRHNIITILKSLKSIISSSIAPDVEKVSFSQPCAQRLFFLLVPTAPMDCPQL